MSQTIPARADVDARFTWNLSDIFPTDDAWREEFARVHVKERFQMSQTIPARADVDARFTWNLSDIFPTDDAWREEFARVHAQLDILRGYQGKLGEHAQTLLSFLRLGDELSLALDKLGNYARRKSDEDTRNAAYQEMSAQQAWQLCPPQIRRRYPQRSISGNERAVYEPRGRNRRSVGV